MSRNDAPTHNTLEGMMRDLNKRMQAAERFLHHHGDGTAAGASSSGELMFTGLRGEWASTPDGAGLDLTDLCIIAHIAPETWTPTANKHIVSKWREPSQYAYTFRLSTTGALILAHSGNGTGFLSATSVALPAMAARTPLWVAAGIDVNNGAAGHTVRFWTSSDGVTWTQLGPDQVVAGTRTIFNNTAPVIIGTHDLDQGTSQWQGEIRHVMIRDSTTPTTGALLAHFDGTIARRGHTQTDSTGKVWTVSDPRPLGVIAVGPLVGGSTSVAAGGSVNVTTAPSAVTFKIGRRYRVQLRIRAHTLGVGEYVLRASAAGADLAFGGIWHAVHQAFGSFNGVWVIDGDGASYTPVGKFTNQGAAALTVYHDTTGGLTVEDIGPMPPQV